MVSFPPVSPPRTYTPPSPHPYAPHAQPIPFFSILSPAQYWVRSTDHLALLYAISSIPPLQTGIYIYIYIYIYLFIGMYNSLYTFCAIHCKIYTFVIFNSRHPHSLCKKNVKWSRYRPGVAQRVGRGIALLFHDRGTRRGWVVSSTPWPHFTPGKDPVPILQEAGWAPGLVWTGGKTRPYRD